MADLPPAPVTSTQGTDQGPRHLPRRPSCPASSAGPSLTTLLPDRRAILDNVVDGYPPIVAGLEHDIGQIEASVFSGAFAQFGYS